MKPENVICLESDAFRKLIDSLVVYIKNECTTGNGKNQLQNIKKGGVIDQQYTYNANHLVETFDQKIDGGSYPTKYFYNSNNDISKITYPQNFSVDYAYNTRGMLTHIYKGGTTNIIYQVNSTNILGQVTGYTLGNGKTSAVTYQNNGMPSNFSTAGVQNLNMVFNMANGNLESRTDVFNGNQTEAFTYETALDRLKTIAYNGGSPVTIDYGTNGNITQKYDAGNYTYDNTKKNAVITTTLACGVTGAQSVNLQNIDYNHFNKPTSIVQNSQTLTFTYNNNHDRIKTQLAASGVTTTRLFVGNYERESKSTGAARHIYYIHGPDGLVCIAVKLGTNAAQYFYTYTDHLGSIISVTNTSGVVQGEQNYDAWGRQRNADNWTDYTNIGTITLNGFVLDRGYTGHQHLKEFGIIHMNGRLYDPIVGRMLNPDNFVQDATSTQAYNRYSYVVNNPLKYTDPSGWIRNYITYDDILGHQSLMEGLAQVQAGMEWMMGSRSGFGGNFTYEWTYRTYISDADQKAADESWLKYGIALSPPYTIEFYQKPIYQPSGLQFTQPFAMGMANVVAPTGDMAAMGGGGSYFQGNNGKGWTKKELGISSSDNSQTQLKKVLLKVKVNDWVKGWAFSFIDNKIGLVIEKVTRISKTEFAITPTGTGESFGIKIDAKITINESSLSINGKVVNVYKIKLYGVAKGVEVKDYGFFNDLYLYENRMYFKTPDGNLKYFTTN